MDAASRIRTALAVLAVAPVAMGGLWLRARACPQRDVVTATLPQVELPQRRLHPAISDEALSGGLDLAATLSAGRPVMRAGVLGGAGLLVLPMAERCPSGLAARLAQAMDARAHPLALVALDEGVEADESLPPALADRLGLFLNLEGLSADDIGDIATAPEVLARARGALPGVGLPDGAVAALARAAAELGIGSARAPLLALAAARALAALAGRGVAEEADLTLAAELVFAHRAAPLAETPETAQQNAPPEPEPQDSAEPQAEAQPEGLPSEILVEAARAALPDDLLARLAQGRAARAARQRAAPAMRGRAIGAGGRCPRARASRMATGGWIWWPRCAPLHRGRACVGPRRRARPARCT